MNTCREYALALSSFVDGELTEPEKTMLLDHVEVCEDCRARLAELMVMHAAFEDLEEYDAPEHFAEGVMARLHEEAAPKKTAHRRRWMGLAACAAVVIMAASALPRMGASTDCAADSAEDVPLMTMDLAQEPPEEKEFTDACTSVQHDGMSFYAGTEARELTANAQNAPTGEKEDSHAVFYALSDDAEAFLIRQGLGEQIYEANDTVCSYLVPAELLHEMAEQGLLTETGREQTAPDAVAEGSVIVVVRMAEEVQP